MEKKNVWESYDEKKLSQVEKFAKEYMQFLDG